MISIKRTGGFAGLTEEIASLDISTLDAFASEQVKQIVKNIGFFDLPTNIPGDSVGADLYVYEITVIDGTRQRTVAFVDDAGPATASLRQLVSSVTAL